MGLIKHSLKRLAPGLFRSAKQLRNRMRFRFGHGGSEHRAKSVLVKQYGKCVLSGPFQGMKYTDDVACSAYVAKLVGSYEQELHAVLERLIAGDFNVVVDVGCAEGYYAVGCAMRMPGAVIYAFDTDPDAQHYCGRLARLNGMSQRVHVAGLCDHAALQRLAGARTLIICDCEGFEADLLDVSKVPALADTEMLVELHEFIKPGLTAALLGRFRSTHTVTLIDTVERDPAAYPVLDKIAPLDRPWAVREGRPAAMQWAHLAPHGHDERRM